jgi:hypothetical protein
LTATSRARDALANPSSDAATPGLSDEVWVVVVIDPGRRVAGLRSSA